MNEASPDSGNPPSKCDRTSASPLLRGLLAEATDPETQNEWQRKELRCDAWRTPMLELRTRRGAVHNARVHNVSGKGLCALCPRKIDNCETVSLRRFGSTGPYEQFRVVHVTGTVGGFKVGLVLHTD